MSKIIRSHNTEMLWWKWDNLFYFYLPSDIMRKLLKRKMQNICAEHREHSSFQFSLVETYRL